MNGDGTGNTVVGLGEERGAPGKLPRDCEGDKGSVRESCEWRSLPLPSCGLPHHEFSPAGQRCPFLEAGTLEDTNARILRNQATFDNDLKTM